MALTHSRFTPLHKIRYGVGAGDVREPGFSHFGEELDAKWRAELLDEGLDILAGLWRGEPFSYKGTHYRVEEVAFLPKPVQQPRIPIWVGGRRRGEDWKQEQALIQTLAEAGAIWWVEWIPPSDRQTMHAAVKRGPLRPE
ncbi:MAG TPA: LLM class flavin-dependent oxidoreductase [Ktedonobacteraceae bacterium]